MFPRKRYFVKAPFFEFWLKKIATITTHFPVNQQDFWELIIQPELLMFGSAPFVTFFPENPA